MTEATWHAPQCVYVNLNIWIYLSTSFPITISLFSMSVTLFLVCKDVHLYHFFFLDSTYKIGHMICLFLSYVTQCDNL